jgi:hypothetical protein
MAQNVLRPGFTNVQVLIADVVQTLKANGFTLLNSYNLEANGNPIYTNQAPNHTNATGFYVLAPTTTVDPLAVEDSDTGNAQYNNRQPWRLVIHAANLPDQNSFIRVWVCHAQQIVDEGGVVRVAAYATNKESGFLFTNNLKQSTGSVRNAFFHRGGAGNSVAFPWSCHTAGTDEASIPLTYTLSVTNHGIVFSMWAENQDGSGDCFNWFAVQRMVKDDGSILLDEKSPLVCVFSQNGGGGVDSDTLVTLGIQYFIVCEQDIHAPTPPLSAVALTADSVPFINPIQQVAFLTNRNFVFKFPQGLNTQRHYYPYSLDLIGYTSADVLSNKSVNDLTIFGEARTYTALNANSKNNRGMRLVALTAGAGI